MNNIVAGIVLYNPDLERLKLNIESVLPQVDIVYCYDNASENIINIENLFKCYQNIVLIKSETNVGIAKALNYMADLAVKNNVMWLYTLDQDSITPDNAIERFKECMERDVAIICPAYIDKRNFDKHSLLKIGIEEVEYCITSGSLTNLLVWEKVKGFDEYLFIGFVDNEYSYRVRLNGFRIIRCNDVVLDHELGNITLKKHAKLYIRLSKLLGIEKLRALAYETSISPFRVYYAIRNMIYLTKKYRGFEQVAFSYRKALNIAIRSILRGNDKVEVSKSIVKGAICSIKKQVRKYEIER